MEIQDYVIFEKTVPQKKADFVPFPEQLDKRICRFLKNQGIDQLYCHQGEMFEKAADGKNIVITTSTASGKTLSFLLPVIQALLEDPTARAIFLYPTKALAADQMRALQPWMREFPDHIVAGVYDGDTPAEERRRIRKSANMILTNPEMLNGSFLPNHSRYGIDFIFSRLTYVVVDELHIYRGAFGSHLSNVFRRLDRICRYYHSQPVFLCSSATIANPSELAAKICGKSFFCISRDGAGSSEKCYRLLAPPKITGRDKSYYGQESATSFASKILPELVKEEKSFLCFAKSRRNVEVLLREARDQLKAEPYQGEKMAGQIAGYRAGYTPIERKEIEGNMIQGRLKGLVATNALELGIDIGSIEQTLLVGYPGTRASFWQQSGRAGRGKQRAVNDLILDFTPADQYIALHPEWLFEGSCEEAIVDPDNLLIELAHIRAAAAELPLSLDDAAVFPDLGETIPVLLNVGEVRADAGRFSWMGGSYPAGDFSMRNIDQNQFQLVEENSDKTITCMDEGQAYREIHEGAVYLHEGETYQVVRMDLERRCSKCVPYLGNYYTVASGEETVHVIHRQKDCSFKRMQAGFGDVKVRESIYMYKKLQFHTHQNMGYGHLQQPLTKEYDTEGAWILIPENIVKGYRQLLRPNAQGILERNNHFEGLCFALKHAAQMITMTEEHDINVTTSQMNQELAMALSDQTALYFYDAYVGGLGFSERIYDRMPEVINGAKELIRSCPCKDGCAVCVGDHRLDKRIVLWGIENLAQESAMPSGIKEVSYGKSTWQKKAFHFEELASVFPELSKELKKNGEQFALFFGMVTECEVRQSRLILTVSDSFYAKWAMEPENRQAIRSMIETYVETPPGFQIQISTGTKTQRDFSIQDKIARRYQTIKGKSDDR